MFFVSTFHPSFILNCQHVPEAHENNRKIPNVAVASGSLQTRPAAIFLQITSLCDLTLFNFNLCPYPQNNQSEGPSAVVTVKSNN